MSRYFYGPQSEMFSFYRIPKVLFQYEKYQSLSAEARILYGLLLDRMDLSAKNNWIDESGRIYIIFTVEEIMEKLACGNKKACALLAELEDKGNLIERQRQGLGKPNLIYVLNFMEVDCDEKGHFLKCQNDTSGSVISTRLEVSKRHGNDTDSNDTEYSDTDSLLSVGTIGSEAMRIRHQYGAYFREALELDILYQDKSLNQDILHALVDLMVDICCSERLTVRINREDYPIEVIKSRFMKLDSGHIRYVLYSLSENTTRVRDMKQYMLAVLYNAPTTMESYYQNWVRHDMAEGKI